MFIRTTVRKCAGNVGGEALRLTYATMRLLYYGIIVLKDKIVQQTVLKSEVMDWVEFADGVQKFGRAVVRDGDGRNKTSVNIMRLFTCIILRSGNTNSTNFRRGGVPVFSAPRECGLRKFSQSYALQL